MCVFCLSRLDSIIFSPVGKPSKLQVSQDGNGPHSTPGLARTTRPLPLSQPIRRTCLTRNRYETLQLSAKKKKKEWRKPGKTRNEIKQKYASSRSAPQFGLAARPAGAKFNRLWGEQKGKAPTQFLARRTCCFLRGTGHTNVMIPQRQVATNMSSSFFPPCFFCPGQRRLYALSGSGRAIKKKQKGQANVWPKPRGSRRDWST